MNYTEDDTFARLKRPPLQEMRKMVMLWSGDFRDIRSLRVFLKDHYWDLDEYDRTRTENEQHT